MQDLASAEARVVTPSVQHLRDVRSAGVAWGAGLLGGLCCIGSALAFGAGIAGLSFFGTWMDRYKGYFVAASVLLMALWIGRLLRSHGLSRRGFRGAIKRVRRQVIVMAITYGVTPGASFAVAAAVRGM